MTNTMDQYKVSGNDFIPDVCLDKERGIFVIGGRSIPENPQTIYDPIIEWWKYYVNNPNADTIIDLGFEYINSSSIMQIARIMSLLDTIHNKKSMVMARWHYNESDTDSRNQAERLSKMVSFPFSLVADASK